MWGISGKQAVKVKFDPSCIYLKCHEVCNGKSLKISKQEVTSPPPLSSPCSSWLLLIELLLCVKNSARNLTKCSASTLVSEGNSEKVLVHI